MCSPLKTDRQEERAKTHVSPPEGSPAATESLKSQSYIYVVMQTGVRNQIAGVMDDIQMVSIGRYEAPLER